MTVRVLILRAACSCYPPPPIGLHCREQVDAAVAEHILPGLAAKIADAKVVVRRAASQALVAYMYSTRDKETVMRCLLHLGLESSEWRSRQATALFLSLPTTPLDSVSSALQFELLCATVSLLSDRVDAVTTSAKQALSQLRVAFADEFEVLRADQRTHAPLFSPSCPHPWRPRPQHPLPCPHCVPIKCGPFCVPPRMVALATPTPPPRPLQPHMQAHMSALPPALRVVFETLEAGDNPGDSTDGDSGALLEFGFVTPRLMGQLHETGNWQARGSTPAPSTAAAVSLSASALVLARARCTLPPFLPTRRAAPPPLPPSAPRTSPSLLMAADPSAGRRRVAACLVAALARAGGARRAASRRTPRVSDGAARRLEL